MRLFVHLCLSVCLLTELLITTDHIFMKFYGMDGYNPGISRLDDSLRFSSDADIVRLTNARIIIIIIIINDLDPSSRSLEVTRSKSFFLRITAFKNVVESPRKLKCSLLKSLNN